MISHYPNEHALILIRIISMFYFSVKDLAYYQMIRLYASKSLSSVQKDLLSLVMSLRLYSPAIENFNQVSV